MSLSRVTLLVLALGLSACAKQDALRVLSPTGDGPDEFRIVPHKPLETPKSYAELPAPTPGGTNRTDLTPKADMVAALGGSRSAVEDRGVSSADGALVSYASRSGVEANVRQVARLEDEEYRKKRGRFGQFRLKKDDFYDKVYKPLALGQADEVWRWRRAGARTPAYPADLQ